MKKLLLSILTLLYLASTTGAMLETHFCMGKVAGWSIGNSTDELCGRCGMEKINSGDNGCCSDQSTFVKNTADQKPGNPLVTPVPLFACTEKLALENQHYIFTSTETAKPLGDAVRRSSSTPLHVLISVFRI